MNYIKTKLLYSTNENKKKFQQVLISNLQKLLFLDTYNMLLDVLSLLYNTLLYILLQFFVYDLINSLQYKEL